LAFLSHSDWFMRSPHSPLRQHIAGSIALRILNFRFDYTHNWLGHGGRTSLPSNPHPDVIAGGRWSGERKLQFVDDIGHKKMISLVWHKGVHNRIDSISTHSRRSLKSLVSVENGTPNISPLTRAIRVARPTLLWGILRPGRDLAAALMVCSGAPNNVLTTIFSGTDTGIFPVMVAFITVATILLWRGRVACIVLLMVGGHHEDSCHLSL